MNSGKNHVTTNMLKNLFTSFEPPVIDEVTNTVNVAETFVDQNGNQVGNQSEIGYQQLGNRKFYESIKRRNNCEGELRFD